jgi:putative ABC transport system substrate-binding protein
MRRREFLALFSALVPGWAIKARSETAGLPIVGYLSPTSAEGGAPYIAAVRSGLAEAGYREGQNVRIESRWADDRPDRLPALAADLVGRGVNVIVTSAIRAALAAKDATSTIPIVFATANDPVQFKLVAGLNRPNGNLTGVTYLSSALGEKRLGLLHEVGRRRRGVRTTRLRRPQKHRSSARTLTAHGKPALRSRCARALPRPPHPSPRT